MQTHNARTVRGTDDFGVAGMAAAVEIDGERVPALIRESRREPEEHVRVVLDVDGHDQLLDVARERVEVLG